MSVAKLSEWPNMMHVQGTLKFYLSNTAVLAFIAIALAGGALLRMPVWAIIPDPTAFPQWVVCARMMNRFPHAVALFATKPPQVLAVTLRTVAFILLATLITVFDLLNYSTFVAINQGFSALESNKWRL